MVIKILIDNRIRGHGVTLVKDQCRLDIRKYSFSQRAINEWNTLATCCVTGSSVFKNKVDTYLRRTGYAWLPRPLAIWAFALDGNLICGKVQSEALKMRVN